MRLLLIVEQVVLLFLILLFQLGLKDLLVQQDQLVQLVHKDYKDLQGQLVLQD